MTQDYSGLLRTTRVCSGLLRFSLSFYRLSRLTHTAWTREQPRWHLVLRLLRTPPKLLSGNDGAFRVCQDVRGSITLGGISIDIAVTEKPMEIGLFNVQIGEDGVLIPSAPSYQRLQGSSLAFCFPSRGHPVGSLLFPVSFIFLPSPSYIPRSSAPPRTFPSIIQRRHHQTIPF